MPTLLEKPVAPSGSDRQIASAACALLEALAPSAPAVQLTGEGQTLTLPAPVVRLLSEILKEMARGNAVTLLPVQTLITTQNAADLLQVSRPFLIGLLEAGKIPYQRLGRHRRILLQYLLAFKEKTDAARADVLRILTEEAQELGLGY